MKLLVITLCALAPLNTFIFILNPIRAGQDVRAQSPTPTTSPVSTPTPLTSRLLALDDYEPQSVAAIYFKLNSAVLSEEGKAKLDEFATKALNSKGYLFEVSGFADSTGSIERNRVLSQRRSDAVIRYLVLNHNIPLRRFVTPYGFGDLKPVGDDRTPEGRQLNRRVEVKLLVNNNVIQPTPSPSVTPTPSPSAVPTPKASPRSSPRPLPSRLPSPSPGPSPSPYSTDWEAMIRNEEQKLRDSKIVFNPPAEMQERETEKMQARISFDDIGDALAKGLQGPGPIQQEPLKVSEIMKVTLTGDGNAFLIQRIGEEEQVVAGKQYAQWEWHVTALQAGEQKLTLTATATIYLQGRGEKPIHYKTLEKPIVVRVDRWYTLKQFLANNWQWLWAVVLVPVAGLLWGLRKRKSRRAGFR